MGKMASSPLRRVRVGAYGSVGESGHLSDGKPFWFAGERRTRTLGGSVRKRERGGRWDVGRTWEGVCALLRASEREAEVAGEWPFPSRRRATHPRINPARFSSMGASACVKPSAGCVTVTRCVSTECACGLVELARVELAPRELPQ